MSITPKEKELVAIGISVAAGCKPCTDHHVNVARKARATDEEIRRAVADALGVRRKASDFMEAHALAHLREKPKLGGVGLVAELSRIKALVAVGAAFAVNCVSSVEHHLAAADVSGVSQDDIVEIVKLAVFIKKMAASHVERLVGMSEEEAA